MVDIDTSVRITQTELENFQRLNQEKREKMDQYEESRLAIIAKLKRGIPIDPGRLTARVDQSTRRIPSWSHIEDVLGRTKTQELRGQVEPTLVKTLVISNSYRDHR
jgi:hypothetical protein